MGVPVIDLDRLARQAVAPSGPALKKIVSAFGKEVLNPDGSLNRKTIRKKIVRDNAARRTLEEIVHPEIERLLRAEVSGMDTGQVPFVVVEVPLLFESGMEGAFDAVILVMAEERLQKKRLAKRDRISEEEAGLLLKVQIPDEMKVDHSDFVVLNTGTMKSLHDAVSRIFLILNKKYSKNGEIA